MHRQLLKPPWLLKQYTNALFYLEKARVQVLWMGENNSIRPEDKKKLKALNEFMAKLKEKQVEE